MKGIVVGSANTDLIIHVDKLPSLGNTEVGHGFTRGPGGKGANQAVCLSRLGVDTHFVGRFGKDEFSSLLLEDIKNYGLNLKYSVIDEKHQGGVVFIVVDKTGNNTMIADFGSNLYLSSDDVNNASKLFEEADLLLLQFEVSEDANKKAISLAKRNSCKIILNPAPFRIFDPDVLQYIDVLTPNLFELNQILKYLKGRNIVPQDTSDVQLIENGAQILIDRGVKHVIVTLGSRGCIYVSKNKKYRFGTFKVDPVDSTAAGDVFTSAFAFRYVKGDNIEDAIRFASAASAIAITRKGAIKSIPNLDEVEDFLRYNRIKPFKERDKV